MKQRLFKSLLGLTLGSVLLVVILFGWLALRYIMSDSLQGLKLEARLLAEMAAKDGVSVEQLEQAKLQDRVTLVDQEGRVIYDNFSPTQDMDLHHDREEIQEALQAGEGSAKRLSATLGKNILYYAVRLPDGRVLRLARTNEVMFQQAHILLGYMALVLLLLLGGAFFAARSITKRALLPLEQLDLEAVDTPKEAVYPELQPIVARFAQQQEKLTQGMQRYKAKKQELKAVTNNMDEGMLFLDSAWQVVSLNKSASSFFGKAKQDLIGQPIEALLPSEELARLRRQVQEQGKSRIVLKRKAAYYQFNGSRIDDKGYVLLIMDVTERTAAERLRREFSANVSHELKTPLQSILGYSEIMLSGLVKPEDNERFLQKINDEAHKLLQLIDDTIKLSKLDELNHDMLEEFSLVEAAQTAINRLKDKAEELKISMSLENTIPQEDGCQIMGNITLMGEVLTNLLDNGLKYNRPGGSVCLRLSEKGDKYVVKVLDTGTGIAAEEVPHIFERFYRIDRSRNKGIEGSGLGLSIVKHGVQFHGGTVRVKSTLGVGTEFIIKLPKKLSLM